ncbi:hypothetical protein JW898_02950 [Candidatus Woesearchaeota archaeon]|nr:hypothetical protein [Candidatus Woesearchaeota archaeon]
MQKDAETDSEEAPEVISFEEEAIGYIEDELDQGYGLDQIKKGLIEEGYPQEMIEFAVQYVQKHRKVSKKDKEKEVKRADEHHFQRRFNLPVMSIIAAVLVLILLFMFIRLGEEEPKELPEKIDIFLYDNLGIVPGQHRIASSIQTYSRDELLDSIKAGLTLEQEKANPLLSNLKVSEAVQGFQKRVTVFDITGGGTGIQKKALVEIRFQADRDLDILKIIESVPKTTAVSDEIVLTQGGVIAKKDPIIMFTFSDVKQGTALKAVYVINKKLSVPDTLTFAAEEASFLPRTAVQKVCGDGRCVEGESYLSCCQDCGCLPGFSCESNACVPAEKDQCSTDADCNDKESSTRDTCSGRPKTCQHTQITECAGGDGYCPEACSYEQDNDCKPAAAEPEKTIDLPGLNITGEQEPPKITFVRLTPENVTIGGEILVEAEATDANGKEDIARVWFEVLELAQTHGESGDMNDAGKEGDSAADDGTYTAKNPIEEYYLTGFYHVTVFAQDHAGNKKKSQATFRVV